MPIDQIKVRCAVINDLPSIMHILQETITAMHQEGVYQWNEVYPTLELIEADIQQQSLYVALNSFDSILGFIVLNESQPENYKLLPWQENQKKVFSVHRLAIAKECSSKKIATQLYNQIEEIAKANNGTSMRIDTAANNIKAQQFFLKQGYSWIGNMKYNDYGHLYSKYYDMLFYCYEKPLSN